MQCAFQIANSPQKYSELLQFEGVFQPRCESLKCCQGTFATFDFEKNGIKFCQTKKYLVPVNDFIQKLSPAPELQYKVVAKFFETPIKNPFVSCWEKRFDHAEAESVLLNVLLEIFATGHKSDIFITANPLASVDKNSTKIVVLVDSPATDLVGLERLDSIVGHIYREKLTATFVDLSLQQTPTSDFQKKIQKKFMKPIFQHLSASSLAKFSEICER